MTHNFSQTVTRTYSGPTVTVDGCGTYCVPLPAVTFTAADFDPGAVITDVNVFIIWQKTDGSCAAPAGGSSFHGETNFRIDGPAALGNQILATPGTWTGSSGNPTVTTLFDQSGAILPGTGTPFSGTFQPNGGDLDAFNGLSPVGSWNLAAGDTALADPLCVQSYSVTITAAPAINTPPNAVCTNYTANLDATGNVTIAASDVDGGSNDAEGPITLSVSPNSFTCADVGANTVTLTVTDSGGLTDSCTATVTVEDNIAPTAVCQNITVQLDASGNASIVAADVDGGSSDNCALASLSVSPSSFTCADVGANTVTLTVTDAAGNSSTCTAIVTVEDVTNPTVTCPADQTVDPGPGNLQYELPDYWANGDATAADNCTDPVTIFTQDPAPGTLLEDGVYTITLCATDEYGNENCCTFELTVESVLGADDFTVALDGIDMYPNPARDVVTITNPNGAQLDRLSIYDATGRLVVTHNINGATTDYNFNVSNLSSATYLVVIEGPQGSLTKQLIRE